MKTALIFMAFALTSSPTPADNYYSWISPEIADTITECVLNGEYREYLDFNGDGALSIADTVGVLKRYQDNIAYGNEITMDSKTVQAIFDENGMDVINWEIDEIEGEITREYSITTNCIIEADLYCELIDFSTEHIRVQLNPFEERVTVIS